ncbi:MAG: anti-sigma factor [Planctomycetia bacterium]|nr:anti-sigma factor [Planctomycetia bacterium]
MSGFDNEHDNASWASAPGSGPSDWEFAAAAVELALVRRAGRAPAHLPRVTAVETRPTPKSVGGQSAGRSWLAAAGWWTAACLAGVLAWQWSGASRIAAPPSGDGKPPVLAELRGKLLDEDPEAVTVAWKKAGDDAAIVAGEADLEAVGALGDVVWSSARQQGYMRFRGLAANDPTMAQYQLWIFDAERDEAYPVDGGVFDVPAAGGDVVVRIDPRLRVSRATAFAITVEKPGGVVVSSRKRLPLLAAVP